MSSTNIESSRYILSALQSRALWSPARRLSGAALAPSSNKGKSDDYTKLVILRQTLPLQSADLPRNRLSIAMVSAH
jgi:hypothetical protein